MFSNDTNVYKDLLILSLMTKSRQIIIFVGFLIFIMFPVLGIYFEIQRLYISSIVFFILMFLIGLLILSAVFTKEENEEY